MLGLFLVDSLLCPCSVGLVNFGMLADANKGFIGRTVVIIVGLFTLVTAIFKAYVICTHPAFKATAHKDKSSALTTENVRTMVHLCFSARTCVCVCDLVLQR